MPSGKKPNLERQRRIAELRAEGMSYAQIGRLLGVTAECVRQNLNPQPRIRSTRIRCRDCRGEINPAGAMPRDDGDVLCLRCLARQPDPGFGECLKAFRLEAGLKIVDLARKARINVNLITCYEHGRVRAPRWQCMLRLFEALGVQLSVCRHEQMVTIAFGRHSSRDRIQAPFGIDPRRVASAL